MFEPLDDAASSREERGNCHIHDTNMPHTQGQTPQGLRLAFAGTSAFVPWRRALSKSTAKGRTHTAGCSVRRGQGKVTTTAVVDIFESGKQLAIDVLGSPQVYPTIMQIGSAFAGGTVGVMGTLIALEWAKIDTLERQQCSYCRGTGKLICGSCCGLRVMPDAQTGQKDCENCEGQGGVECMHCEGSGRLLPIRYERALRAQYRENWNRGTFDGDFFDNPRL